jgi:hypothetical protein
MPGTLATGHGASTPNMLIACILHELPMCHTKLPIGCLLAV